jgi:plasmid stability protein
MNRRYIPRRQGDGWDVYDTLLDRVISEEIPGDWAWMAHDIAYHRNQDWALQLRSAQRNPTPGVDMAKRRIDLPEELYERLRALAARDHVSINAAASRILSAGVQADELAQRRQLRELYDHTLDVLTDKGIL